MEVEVNKPHQSAEGCPTITNTVTKKSQEIVVDCTFCSDFGSLSGWALQHGHSVLTRPSSPKHIREAMAVFGNLNLSELDMRLLDGLAWFISSGANRAISTDTYQIVAGWSPA